jgi:hypothetical protein
MTDKAREPFDWKRGRARARTMTDEQLWGAILDIRKVLPFSDRLDRVYGGSRGGWYRDESTMYYKEMERRRNA